MTQIQHAVIVRWNAISNLKKLAQTSIILAFMKSSFKPMQRQNVQSALVDSNFALPGVVSTEAPAGPAPLQLDICRWELQPEFQ
eukprot:5927164-Amphidinium_carterae.1